MWSIKILAPIFVRPEAVTDLRKGLYSPLQIIETIIIGTIDTNFNIWKLAYQNLQNFSECFDCKIFIYNFSVVLF